ncbi:FAD-binding and (Fe-S)-binding domain-containing protein [Spiractinospora alimapuensis]|uniref:FAD-binding and (Fe-S)-binding domain-containing protein n=1 Tax=Spiractinospora alimapuensis TaxID=2820884 RepID=UPI001F26569F|nr:FAD-binding and (Fe-S)-binding domain-containing protein [Spiractinospora alimapuensis]
MVRSATASDNDVIGQLRQRVRGEVSDATIHRAVYSADASVYRQVPRAVVHPLDEDDLIGAVTTCTAAGVPVTLRGAGTSIAGQVLGRGVVIDTSRHMREVLEIDPENQTAWVQPGVILDDLRAQAGKHGLTFGPDPSTHSRCTMGGMIGNDSCGSHSVAWGRTADNVEELDVLLADGTRLTVGPTSREDLDALCSRSDRVGELYRDLRAMVEGNLALLRTGFPSLQRRVSGYALDSLLPENEFNLARALVGSEGTCAVVLRAKVRLVRPPASRVLVVAAFPDMPTAADSVPSILDLQPLTVEGTGADMVATLKAHSPDGRGPAALSQLPEGGGWLFIEVGGDDPTDAAERGRAMCAALDRLATATRVVTDKAQQRSLWSLREAGSGLVTRSPDGAEAWPGWEDAAVPPERLGAYLKDFQRLQAKHGLGGIPYGHFGEGCVHIRIDFDLDSDGGRAVFRAFMEDAADLVVSYGGSVSGEHGDGQARGELLPRMYSPELMALFARFKAMFDPEDHLNPGIGVQPRPMDEDLRVSGPVRALPLALSYPHDDGSLAKATRRCVGVGKCVDTSTGVMCPSYMVTGKEEHSTRGRARLLGEMLRGELVTDGWQSTEVRDALDLCLSCKGCSSDCPVNVDMATYKSEFLHQHYRGRVRPMSHYSMGALPLWLRFAGPAAPVANAVARSRVLSPALKRVAGVEPKRDLPEFANTTLIRAMRRRDRRRRDVPREAPRGEVLLFPDSFTNYLDPGVGAAAVEVLEHAGFSVRLPRGPVCCGLTWVSTGQLDVARFVMRRTTKVLADAVAADIPIVGLEPSCTSALRGELPEMVDTDAARGVGERTTTLAGLLAERASDVDFGELSGDALTQVHCHQHATLGFEADRDLIGGTGLSNRVLDSGCCGLAGNFGFEPGHYDVSVGAAERVLIPEVRAADADTTVLADGFSCRTQVDQLTGRRPEHLAEVLRRAIRTGTDAGHAAGASDVSDPAPDA